MKTKEKFIVNIKGENFIKYSGLLDLAHQVKIKSINTELVQFTKVENNMTAVAKAVITTYDNRNFEDYGDASPSSVNKKLEPHIIRVAITRAKARAFRDLTNVEMMSFVEIIELDEEKEKNNQNMITEEQMKFLMELAEVKNMTEKMRELIETRYRLSNSKELNIEQASDLCRYLQRL